MKLLPLAVLAVVVGVALLVSPTLFVGNSAIFANAATGTAAQGESNTTDFGKSLNNSTYAATADRLGLVASPYGFIIGPSLVILIGLIVATSCYWVLKRAQIGQRVVQYFI